MDEAKMGSLGEPEGVAKAASTTEPGLGGHEDHLPTTRLPPIAPPPRPRSVPPPAPLGGGFGPESADELTTVRPASFAPPASLPMSRWKVLFDSMRKRASRAVRAPALSSHDPVALGRRLGATCGGLGVVLAVMAVIAGLRGAPPGASQVVAASTILAHAIVAAALLGFSLGLLFLAERLYVLHSSLGSRRPPSREAASRDSRPDGVN